MNTIYCTRFFSDWKDVFSDFYRFFLKNFCQFLEEPADPPEDGGNALPKEAKYRAQPPPRQADGQKRTQYHGHKIPQPKIAATDAEAYLQPGIDQSGGKEKVGKGPLAQRAKEAVVQPQREAYPKALQQLPGDLCRGAHENSRRSRDPAGRSGS